MSLEQQAASQRPPTAPPTKFKWTDDTSVMLLEEVGNNEAHIPPYGKQEKHYVQVVECLNKRGVQVTSARTCQRQFKKLLKSFLKKDEADAGASGKEPDDEGISVNVIGIHLHHAALTDQEWIRAQRFISDQCCLIYFFHLVLRLCTWTLYSKMPNRRNIPTRFPHMQFHNDFE